MMHRSARGSSSIKPGKSGEVFQRRGAWLMSSPRNRTEKTRRRRVAVDAPGSVQGEHVKRHGVAGFEGPAEDRIVVAMRFDVGQVGETALAGTTWPGNP